jgi:hypothetical protein
MKTSTKVVFIVLGTTIAGAIYYYFKNQSLKKKYQKIDLTTIKSSQLDSLIANPTLQ